MNSDIKYYLMTFAVVFSVVFAMFGFGGVMAVSAEYSQSYQSDQELEFGTLVSLVDDSDTKIVPTTTDNAKNYLGVYVDDAGSTLEINKRDGQYQVATSGDVIALVSDENGAIKKGDKLAISRVDGVAKKALADINVVGVALTDFNSSSTKNSTTEIRLPDGKNLSVTIGPLAMKIYTQKKDIEVKPGIIGWVERLTGKQVTPLKIIVAFLVTLMLIASITVMTSSAIRNTILQASRNPLAKPVIMRALVRIFLFISIISIVGVCLIYLVLRA